MNSADFLLEGHELYAADFEADIDQSEEIDLVRLILGYKDESESACSVREQHNKINYDALHSRQDNSIKVEGQSDEFLPKTAMAVEQLGSFIKNGLVAFGNYFQVDLSPDPGLTVAPGQPANVLTASGVTKLLKHRLEAIEEILPGQLDFPTVIADAVKTGAVASLMVLKVCGRKSPTRRLSIDLKPITEAYNDPVTGQPARRTIQEEQLVMREGTVWKLVIELVHPEDYFPDPTGRGLYEIYRTRKDLYQVIEAADAGEYDKEAVADLTESYSNTEIDSDTDSETNQSPMNKFGSRKEVELLELWGTILGEEGQVLHRNIRCVLANEHFIILKPEPNPYWHQESPFVVCPLIRVPFSVFHKALFDDAVRLNFAQNEVFNLMLDGGLAAVWGNKQVHPHLIANMDDYVNGIPQGAVFLAKPEAAQGEPLVMQIDSGAVPKEAMGMFQLLDSEFERATKINSIQMGQLPKKDVRATEVAAAEQSSSVFFDSIISDVERGLIAKTLRLAWLTMLQNADDWLAEDVVGIIGPEAATAFANMSPAQRYMRYAQGARFKVFGLSALMSRTREFQKIIAAMGVVTQSSMLLQTFLQESSPKKLLFHLYKSLNIDPEDLKITEEEKALLSETIQGMMALQGMASGAQGNQQPQMQPEQQANSPQQIGQAAASSMQQMPQEL